LGITHKEESGRGIGIFAVNETTIRRKIEITRIGR